MDVLKQSHEYRVSILMKGIESYRKFLGLDFRVNEGASMLSVGFLLHTILQTRYFSFALLRLRTGVYIHQNQPTEPAARVFLCVANQ
jgi:hypothetical protein